LTSTPTGTTTATPTNTPLDNDGDGVPGTTEDGAPNGGDGNGDGIPDRDQPEVTSLPSAPGRGYLTLIADCGQNLNVAAFTEPQLGNDTPFNYPFGLLGFTLPCSPANVTVLYHGASIPLVPQIYRKYGPVAPVFGAAQFYTLPGVVFDTTTVAGQAVARVRFTLTDGQLGDDTAVDGLIIDQGGPAVPAASPAPIVSRAGFITLILFLGSIGAAQIWWRKKRGRL
jgi:hypothetical protein